MFSCHQTLTLLATSENNPFKKHVAQLASSESWGYLANVGARRMAKNRTTITLKHRFFFDLPINPPQKGKRISWQVGWNVLHYTRDSLQNCSKHGSDLLSSNCLNVKFNSYCFIFASPSNSEQSFTCHLCPRNLTVIVLLPALGRQSHRVPIAAISRVDNLAYRYHYT